VAHQNHLPEQIQLDDEGCTGPNAAYGLPRRAPSLSSEAEPAVRHQSCDAISEFPQSDQMRGNLFPETPDQDQVTSLWPMMVLVIGGAVTLAWIGVLLWAAFAGAAWVFNALSM
jgi:hypothetical protein